MIEKAVWAGTRHTSFVAAAESVDVLADERDSRARSVSGVSGVAV
jgi:hypothetical protein